MQNKTYRMISFKVDDGMEINWSFLIVCAYLPIGGGRWCCYSMHRCTHTPTSVQHSYSISDNLIARHIYHVAM